MLSKIISSLVRISYLYMGEYHIVFVMSPGALVSKSMTFRKILVESHVARPKTFTFNFRVF